MKKVLLLGVLVSLIFTANAQVIPNAGFENWDSMYENPTGYSTSNTYVDQLTGEYNVMKQSPGFSSNYLVRLVTMDVQGYPFPGFILYGDPSAFIGGGNIQSISGGFPYTQAPDKFVFYARYNCKHSDSAFVIVILKRLGIPYTYKLFKLYGIQDTLKQYSFPIPAVYLPPPFDMIRVTPDTAIIGFASSDVLIQDSITIGNWLEIDKISFEKSGGGAMPAIPNNDFENWVTALEPQNWITTNSLDLVKGQALGVVPVTPGHSGNVAAKITSNIYDIGSSAGSDTLGFLVLGDPNSDNPGMGIIDNPDSLSFWYKYNNAKNTKDNAYAVILFTKFNSSTQQSDQLDSNGFALNATSTFTYKTLKFPNIYGKSPDTIGIYFSSSKFTPTGRGVGNYLIVDDVLLWSHHVGIAVGSNDQNNTFVYPNPANKYVNVQFELNIPSDVTISLVDLNGRKIKTQDFSLYKGKQQIKLDLQEVADGQYLVVIAEGNNSIYSKRIVVRR
jgi:hypothetical protein